MKRHPAWAVAAAILLEEDDALDYEDICHRVIQSSLSGLSEEGGSTPIKTMRTMLTRRCDGILIFEEDFFDRRHFSIKNPKLTNKMPKVAKARAALQAKKEIS